MPLTGTAEIVTAAARAGHGAAAFNVIQLEHAEAIVAEVGGKDGVHAPGAVPTPPKPPLTSRPPAWMRCP